MIRRATLTEVEAYLAEHKPDTFVGVDEAGRGCYAGPIVAAAARVPVDWIPPKGLRDSKKITTHEQRVVICQASQDPRVVVEVSCVSANKIDRMGINPAQAEAQAQAIRGVLQGLLFVVVDGVTPPAIRKDEVRDLYCLPKADNLIPAVSLASCFAKVMQVRLMRDFHKKYPGYGFGKHHAYGSKEHAEALNRLGPCPIHRKSFRPVAKALAKHRGDEKEPSNAWELFDD